MALGAFGMAMVVPLHLPLSWEEAVRHGFSSSDLWIMCPLLGGMITLFYMLSFHPRVRLSAEGVELRDFVSRHFVPWRHVVTLDAEGRGRFVIGVSDGTTASNLQYGGSLGGELIRYRHHRRAVRRVERWRARYADAPGSTRGIEEVEGFPGRVCLVVLAITQVHVFVGIAIHYLGG